MSHGCLGEERLFQTETEGAGVSRGRRDTRPLGKGQEAGDFELGQALREKKTVK